MSRFLLLSILLSGCQHISPFSVQNLSVTQSPMFSLCIPNQGMTKISFENMSLNTHPQEIIWKQVNSDQFHLEIVTPFGNTLAELGVDKDVFSTKNLNFSELKDLTVKDNQVFARGFSTGILIKEFGCFFSGHLPYQWVARANILSSTPLVLIFEGQGRTIELSFPKTNTVCAIVTTSHFWGMGSNSYSWCVAHENETHRTTLKLKDNQKIILESIPE